MAEPLARAGLVLRDDGSIVGASTPQPIPIAPLGRPPAPLPEPPNDERSPRPLAVRYGKAELPVRTTITRPVRGKTTIQLEGRIVGTMYRGKAVHHYRVEGADGVLYLCPAHWLPEDPPLRRPHRQPPRLQHVRRHG